MSKWLEREKNTLQVMLEVHCNHRHHTRGGLCSNCRALSDYAQKRLDRCKFGEHKPICSKCTVHCYKPEMQQQIKAVMRYAGPKMLFIHPFMALRHFWDRRRKCPN